MSLQTSRAQLEAVPTGTTSPRQISPEGDRERLIVLSLELSRRAVTAGSLDELYFLMTNDIRSLVEFDRSYLMIHMQGKSRFVAAGNQPVLETTPKIHDEVTRLASQLKGLPKPILVSNPADLAKLSDESLSEETKTGLATFMEFSGCAAILCVPLNHNNETLGHLVLEYLDGTPPDSSRIMALIKLSSFLSAALAEKWLMHENPNLTPLTQLRLWHERTVLGMRPRYLGIAAGVLLLLVAVVLLVPFASPVGGEAEIVPRDRHLAFARIDGLVDKIFVTEGMHVDRGQVVAAFDSTDLQHKVMTAQRQLELLTTEMVLLRKSSSQDVSKLAESQLVALKRESVLAELKYLEWQKQFINVIAPASGVVVSKQVETLIGKKFKAGEPFCEVAVPGELWVDIYVPEENVDQVRAGHRGGVYLNSDPGHACPITVKEVAPRAEVLPRLGNVYRARATFDGVEAAGFKVGMKGIGRIYTQEENFYSAIARRLQPRWNQFSLHFL